MHKFIYFFLLNILFSHYTGAQIEVNPIISMPKLNDVKLTGGFWDQRLRTTSNVTIPFILKKLHETGRVDNLLYAAGIKDGQFCTRYAFDDSDIYKTIEAASYSLINNYEKKLDVQIDSLIKIISEAQEPDGYLYSARRAPSESIKRMIGSARWVNLQWSHELYNMGHLYESAVAHFQATGKKSLLNIALKNADLLLKTFGPKGIQLPPGHEEIEIGLIKLYKLTQDRRYLDLAKYFMDIRGRGKELTGRESWAEYAQDHKPVTEQEEAVGHAVRAGYLYSAMTDLATITDNKDYENAVRKLWKNVISKKLYITGGVGSTGSGEAFGKNYDLPNASAYNETCSSIANMMWNFRMFKMTGNAKYLDVFERTLYNAFLSGIGMEGNLFFYPNVLQSFGTQERSSWFICACCPPNVARFIESLPQKIYSSKLDELFVNLFASSKANIQLKNATIKIEQTTNYPWDGKINITLYPKTENQKFTLKVRIPIWALGKPIDSDLYSFMEPSSAIALKINGELEKINLENGFAVINRSWNKNDKVELILPMDIHRIKANPLVKADVGKIALQRGPLVYCAEWKDNKDGYTRNILLQDSAKLISEFHSDLLNGITEIKGNVFGYKYNASDQLEKSEHEFIAIPYYSWAHRGAGDMNVWLAETTNSVIPLHSPTLISKSKITSSGGESLSAVNDQLEPKKSYDESIPFFHWWPKKGTEEWVQIEFPDTAEISKVDIYWFDDTGYGECRIPATWQVKYNENGNWKNVFETKKDEISVDKYNSCAFETVRTNAIRIDIQLQKGFSSGIYEIKIE